MSNPSNESALRILIDEVSKLREQVDSMSSTILKMRFDISSLQNQLHTAVAENGFDLEEYAKWMEVRKMAFERDNYTCQDCGWHGHGSVLDPHHVLMRKYHPDKALDLNNIVTLCRKCHVKRHSGVNHYRHKQFNPNAPV